MSRYSETIRNLQKIMTEAYGRFQVHPVGRRVHAWSRELGLVQKLVREKKVTALSQSLAYTTILSLVPIFALFFFVIGVITDKQSIKVSIEEFIGKYFIPEYVNSIFSRLENLYSDKVTFGVIGIPAVFLAGMFLYAKVDASINEIWGSEKERQWFKNGMAFFMTVFFGPMLLILVFSTPPYLQTLPYYKELLDIETVSMVVTQLIPILTSTVVLFVLYLYIPSVHVEAGAAFRGALAGGLMVQVSNYMVSGYLKNFSSYDVVYGSLAIVPIFLLWVFVVWMVVLLGASMAYVYQYHHQTDFLNVDGTYNNESLLSSALQVVLYLAQSFSTKGAAPSFDQLQLILGLNRHRLQYLLKKLLQGKVITSFEDKSKSNAPAIRYQPGVNPTEIMLQDLIGLFYHPKDHVIFPEDLNLLLQKLEIHPSLLKNNISIQDFMDSYPDMLREIDN